MAEHITTYTGDWFYPMAPEPERIHIEDIAHALSLLCRGNGHVKTFFSVGQHCVNCCREAAARGYSDRVTLACLLHDAGECYLSDVPTPFKNSLPSYRSLEDKLLDMVYTKFLGSPLDEKEQALVTCVDKDMLYFDMKILLGETIRPEPPRMKTEFSYQVIPFEETERQYLQLFQELAARMTAGTVCGG